MQIKMIVSCAKLEFSTTLELFKSNQLAQEIIIDGVYLKSLVYLDNYEVEDPDTFISELIEIVEERIAKFEENKVTDKKMTKLNMFCAVLEKFLVRNKQVDIPLTSAVSLIKRAVKYKAILGNNAKESLLGIIKEFEKEEAFVQFLITNLSVISWLISDCLMDPRYSYLCISIFSEVKKHGLESN